MMSHFIVPLLPVECVITLSSLVSPTRQKYLVSYLVCLQSYNTGSPTLYLNLSSVALHSIPVHKVTDLRQRQT